MASVRKTPDKQKTQNRAEVPERLLTFWCPRDENTIEDPLTKLRWLKVNSLVDRKKLYKSFNCLRAGVNLEGHKVFVARCLSNNSTNSPKYLYGHATADDALCYNFSGTIAEYADCWEILLAPPSGYVFGWMQTPNSDAKAVRIGVNDTGNDIFLAQFSYLGSSIPGSLFFLVLKEFCPFPSCLISSSLQLFLAREFVSI